MCVAGMSALWVKGRVAAALHAQPQSGMYNIIPSPRRARHQSVHVCDHRRNSNTKRRLMAHNRAQLDHILYMKCLGRVDSVIRMWVAILCGCLAYSDSDIATPQDRNMNTRDIDTGSANHRPRGHRPLVNWTTDDFTKPRSWSAYSISWPLWGPNSPPPMLFLSIPIPSTVTSSVSFLQLSTHPTSTSLFFSHYLLA